MTTQIQEADIALTLVHGVELIADALDNDPLVNACQLVLDALLEHRLHLPQQRTSPETGGQPCTASPSAPSAASPSPQA